MAAFAQESGGATINGTVTDPSGALIAGAKITATQTATGAQRTTQTSNAGLYSLSALTAGAYDVTVEARASNRPNSPPYRCPSAPW